MATSSQIASTSAQIGNIGKNVPDLASAQDFGSRLMDLLKSYQGIEKYPYAQQSLNAQQEQVNRTMAQVPANLIGANPEIQNSVRSASVSAVQPTVSGAEQSGQTFASRLSTLSDVLNSASSIQQRMESQALQAKSDASNLITNTLANFGPDAFKSIDPGEVARLEKLAGVPAGYVKQVSAALAAREAAQRAQANRTSAAKMQAVTFGDGSVGTFNPNNGKYYTADGQVYTGPVIDTPNTQQDNQPAQQTIEERMAAAGVQRFKSNPNDPGWSFTWNGNPVDYLTAAQAINLSAPEAGQLLFGSTNRADAKAMNEASVIVNRQSELTGKKGTTSGVPAGYKQYGLLATTTFNPKTPLDANAKMYLDYYIKNGAIPSYYQLFGRSSSKNSNSTMSATAQRANELFYEATGSSLPDVNILKGNKALVNANNKILNNQKVISKAIEDNFKLAISGEITNNINKNAKLINQVLNPIRIAIGDPATMAALVSNGTISQEFANLISIRNASGTTVSDKDIAQYLIPFGSSVEQQKAVVARIAQEAQNIQNAFNSTNTDLYAQIDPLEQSTQNPNRIKKLGGTSIFNTNNSGSSDPLGIR